MLRLTVSQLGFTMGVSWSMCKVTIVLVASRYMCGAVA